MQVFQIIFIIAVFLEVIGCIIWLLICAYYWWLDKQDKDLYEMMRDEDIFE